ncbi:hypothetical protein [Streptomyces sp. NPDC051364]
MENPIWDALLPLVREEVDELIRSGRRLHAVKLILPCGLICWRRLNKPNS